MRTLKLTIAYDGTRYAGWQRQRGGGATVQGTLERVLRRILREAVTVVGSGRTDAGVHAVGQVAHIRTRSPIPCDRLRRSLNALLPPDLAVTDVVEAASTFHARFGATSKQYRYRVSTAPVVPPFTRPYVHQVRARLNVALMRREAQALVGRHDFRAFARAPRGERGATRTVTDVSLTRFGQEIRLDITGNGFLHTMVRSVAGTLIDVGRGRRPPGTVRRMLRSGDRRLAGTTAPGKGLTLVAVDYAQDRR